MLAVANTGSSVSPQNKIGHNCWMQVPVLSALGVYRAFNIYVIVFLGLRSEMVDIIGVLV